MNTKEMIEVMQAHVEGKNIEYSVVGDNNWNPTASEPAWAWDRCDYRIAPEPKKGGRWERVEIIRNCLGDYAITTGTTGGRITLDFLTRIPGFGGIDYRSPFDKERVVQSMVPIMFDPFGAALTAGFSGINTSCRPGIPVAAWFWREE